MKPQKAREKGRLTILIVDDDEEMGRLIKKVLDREDYHVKVAENATAGLILLQECPFDLVISDFRMPGMSGIELIREARKISPHTQLILITAFGDVQTYLDAMGAGAFEYINKPIKMNDLKAVIRKASDALYPGQGSVFQEGSTP
ncbi:MAG: response regulator [Deltaproteobacteria bacterium]|nr:response regulator [Deltaproteobacteria bacterium]